MTLYNPSEQARYSQYPERCVMGRAPTLANVRADYSANIALSWLIIQINDYNNFVGIRSEGKNTAQQVHELANIIMARYYHLKLSELMLFFFRLKCGDYGKVYGNINNVDILIALQAFCRDRNIIIDKWESEERKKQQAKDRASAIPWEEYQKLKQERGEATGESAENLSSNALKPENQ